MARAEPATLRYRLLHVATRIARGQRRLFVRIDSAWPWREQLATAFARLHALPQPVTAPAAPARPDPEPAKNPATVTALLARGADTERINDRGQTALGAAVFRGCEPSVRALLKAGANPDAGPRSAITVATVFELREMAHLLRSHQVDDPTDQ